LANINTKVSQLQDSRHKKSPQHLSIEGFLAIADRDSTIRDEDIEEANKFFAKVSLKDFFITESTESSCIEKYLNSI
jgi:hypothetical protein